MCRISTLGLGRMIMLGLYIVLAIQTTNNLVAAQTTKQVTLPASQDIESKSSEHASQQSRITDEVSIRSGLVKKVAGITYPVLFVHGLRSDGSTWKEMIGALDGGNLTGGRLRTTQNNGTTCYRREDWTDGNDLMSYTLESANQIPSGKRYFAIDFSDSDDISFYEQARQLKVIIDCIKMRTDATKISLVGHSMGGLASRFYLQSLLPVPYQYQGDVDRLITIGTPHNGANFVADGLTLPFNFASVAVRDLTFPSTLINHMNAQTAFLQYSLPPISYHSIRFGTSSTGDGIVSLSSQSILANLPASVASGFNSSEVNIDFPKPMGLLCGLANAVLTTSLLRVTHLCQTKDVQSIAAVANILGREYSSVTADSPTDVSVTGFNVKIGYRVKTAEPNFQVGVEWGSSLSSFPNSISDSKFGENYDSFILRVRGVSVSQDATVFYRPFVLINGTKKTGEVKSILIPSILVSQLPAPILSSPIDNAVGQSEQPLLQWQPVTNASTYRVCVSASAASQPTDPNTFNTSGCIQFGQTSATRYQPSSNLLLAGQTYFWRVQAINADMVGALSVIQQFTIQTSSLLAAPVPTTPIDGAPISGTNISLSWQGSASATSYRVIIASDLASLSLSPSENICQNCIVNTTVPDAATSLQLSSSIFARGITYYWRVKARNAAQFGAYSAPQRFFVSPSQCSFGFSQTSLEIPFGGGSFPLTLVSAPGCATTVSTTQPYCSLSANSVTTNSSGQAGLQLTLSQHAGAFARTCSITAGNALVSVTQSGSAPAVSYSFSLNQSFGGSANASVSNGSYGAGTVITVVASPAPGFSFAGWLEGGLSVSSGASWSFPIQAARSITPSFSQLTVTLTGNVSPNASIDQKWRVLGSGLPGTNENSWQGHGGTVSLLSGSTYRVDCADTPYFAPTVKTFDVTVIGNTSFNCNYTPKPQQAFATNLTMKSQPRLSSGTHNSLAKLDDGRVVIWGINRYTDFPNYDVVTEQFNSLSLSLLRPLFLPNANDIAGVNISSGQQNGMFLQTTNGNWKRWWNAANSAVTIPTVESSLSGYIKIARMFGLKADGTLWAINQSGAHTSIGGATDIVDIDGTFSGAGRPIVALRKDGAVLSFASPGTSLPCLIHGISSFGGPFDNCSAPVALPDLSRVVSIAASETNAYAVKDDGTVWVWGSANGLSGAGNGGVFRDPNDYKPLQIPSISQAKQVVASRSSNGAVYVLRTNGQVYAWGANNLGQLGRGTLSASESTPQIIAGLNNIVELGQTDGSSLLALDSSGFVWTVGITYSVGNGTSVTAQSTDVKVSCPNGFIGDLNLTAFAANCVAAPTNTLTISDLNTSLGKQIRVNGVIVSLPYSNAFPAGSAVTIESIPEVGVGTSWRGDFFDGLSRVRTIVMNRGWNISVSPYSCAGWVGNGNRSQGQQPIIYINVPASASTQTVNVFNWTGSSSQPFMACRWGFSTSEPWLNATAGGFGESSFPISISANLSTTQRVGFFRLGGVNGTNIQVTQAASVIIQTPTTVSFTSMLGAPLSTVLRSDILTVSGINTAAPISIVGGEYSIGCNGTFTTASATVNNNETVCLRHLSAATNSTLTNTVLTIGGVSGSFVSKTIANIVNVSVSVLGGAAGSVSSFPNLASCSTTCIFSASVGTALTLTATPFSGFVFTGWTGVTCQAGNSISTCTFVPQGNLNVTTTFAVTPVAFARPLDLNGDGRADLLTRDAAGVLTARLMNGTTVTSTAALLAAGPNWTVTHTGDLNGDGRTDLIFRNSTDGSVVIYLMNGLTIQSSATMLAGGSPWRVAHVADFDGDGKADILWRNSSDNSHAIWRMDGLTILAGSGGIVNAGPWLADQTGDFNGDGKADILWRNTTDGSHAIWLMNGITVLAGSGGIVGAGPWIASHIADFNGDGKSDILWRNTTDGGTVAMWTMNGIAVTGGGTIIGAGVWQATHVGDLDGDGKADILWRNTSDGTIAAWLMNAQTVISGTSLMGANSGWTVQKLLDLNGDGKADIVWRNTDGTIAVWLMNGLSLTSGATIVGPGTTAQVVP